MTLLIVSIITAFVGFLIGRYKDQILERYHNPKEHILTLGDGHMFYVGDKITFEGKRYRITARISTSQVAAKRVLW